MMTTNPSIVSTLTGLIEACKNGQKGFRAAAENVRNEDFQLLFSDLSTQRQHFVGELKRLVANFGGSAETNGSFSAALHRGWMNLKAVATSGDDRTILAECERGEDAAIADYREALKHDEFPLMVREVIQQQALGVKAAHDRVHDLRSRAS